MQVHHAWTGITHDLPNFFSHIWLIAVDRAFCTCGLTFLKRTFWKAEFRIIKKVVALFTEVVPWQTVMVMTIYGNHGLNGLLFPYHSVMLSFQCNLFPMTFNTEGIGDRLLWQFLFWSDLSHSVTIKTDIVLLQGMHNDHLRVPAMTYIATKWPGIAEKDNCCNHHEYGDTILPHDLSYKKITAKNMIFIIFLLQIK